MDDSVVSGAIGRDNVSLKPAADVSTTGLWSVDDGAYPDAAGTYALIVGVSKYPYFKNGSAPARNTYGLGQLFSSAYSAYSVFDWLRTNFFVTDCPVRKVWLLLSPTDQEAALIPHKNYAPADFARVADAVRAWYAALEALAENIAQRSRSLFFFSGHGVEINTDKQVLLPADYLRTYPPMLNEAISTFNLHLGMGVVKVPIQYFLIDACRSDIGSLRQQSGFDGAKILPEPFSGQNPRRNAPIVYATATGASTYQSVVPKEMSFFANGLLNGLSLRATSGIAALTPERLPNGPWAIKLSPLCEYVNASMNQSLIAAGFPGDDPLTIGGIQKAAPPLIVSEVPGPAVAAPPPKPVFSFPNIQVKTLIDKAPAMGPSTSVWDKLKGIAIRTLVTVTSLGSASRGLESETTVQETRAPERADLFSRLETVPDYGHENVTTFFSAAELNEYDGQKWSGIPRSFTDRITRIEGLGRDYRRVCFKTPDATKWYWLRCENWSVEYGFLFPPSDREGEPAEYAIETSTQNDRLEARAVLSPYNAAHFLATADELWRSYAAASPVDAYNRIFSQLQIPTDQIDTAMVILYDKWESPIAATVGSMILLRGGGTREFGDWQENLAHRVAFSSDAAIFVLQRMIQTDTFNEAEAQRCVDDIVKLGLPFTSEAFAYLANISDALLQRFPGDATAAAFAHVAEFNRFSKPGTLFLAVAATDDSPAKGHLRDHLLGLNSPQPAGN